MAAAADAPARTARAQITAPTAATRITSAMCAATAVLLPRLRAKHPATTAAPATASRFITTVPVGAIADAAAAEAYAC